MKKRELVCRNRLRLRDVIIICSNKPRPDIPRGSTSPRREGPHFSKPKPELGKLELDTTRHSVSCVALCCSGANASKFQMLKCICCSCKQVMTHQRRCEENLPRDITRVVANSHLAAAMLLSRSPRLLCLCIFTYILALASRLTLPPKRTLKVQSRDIYERRGRYCQFHEEWPCIQDDAPRSVDLRNLWYVLHFSSDDSEKRPSRRFNILVIGILLIVIENLFNESRISFDVFKDPDYTVKKNFFFTKYLY